MSKDNFEVENPQIEGVLSGLGKKIQKYLPKGWGFSLFIFDFNTDKGSIFYISNAKRDDMLKALKEFIKKEEAK